MPNRKLHDGPTKLVAAFDIGTTFSGISYCILERGQVPQVLGVRRQALQFFLALVSDEAKVPSLLYYDKSGNVRAAGAEVLTESVVKAALTEGWTRAECFVIIDLHLRPKHLASSINWDNYLPPLPSGKSADDVLTDFIKYLFECVKTYIHERHLGFPWSSVENSIEFILTHPNGWEGEQQRYCQAIVRAGLVPGTREGQSRVRMLTDGEAILHFCIANLIDVERAIQAVPRGVVIIDAGGETINLNMFSMKFNAIFCEEIALAECPLQGSVFVTRRANALLQSWKTRRLGTLQHEEITKFTRDFDQTTKHIIKSDKESVHLRVGGLRTNSKKHRIAFGKLKLTGEEATGLFTESIDAIIGAFEQQQKSATTPITMAFLVGGLSKNAWLWSRLRSYFQDKNIDICRPDKHINKAVANGAVLSHVDRNNHVFLRVAGATYGVVRSIPAKANEEEHYRRRLNWESDSKGNFYVPDYFDVKLRRGTHLCGDTGFRDSFSLREETLAAFGTQTVHLMCYRGTLPTPEWTIVASFSTYCIIHLDLSKATEDLVPQGEDSILVYYQLDYDITVFFGPTELRAELGWRTRVSCGPYALL
ncbi:hypothetical protein HD554DRAFT_2014396 [Boletus coccyginus]|nr:hypothetical protein HD554DRAFT_2014396 [Boletus coccyginus]